VEVVPAQPTRHGGDRAGPPEHVEDDVPPVGVELHDPLDQRLGKRRRVSVTASLGRDRPEAVRRPFELLRADVDLARIAGELPLVLREDEDVLPRRDDVRVRRAPPAPPRGAAAHRLLVPDDLGPHDVTEGAQVAREVVMDRSEVLDRRRRNIQDETTARHQDPVQGAPDLQEPAPVDLGGEVVRIAAVGDLHVVGRTRDGELDAPGREAVEDLLRVAADHAVEHGGGPMPGARARHRAVVGGLCRLSVRSAGFPEGGPGSPCEGRPR
jgi:hypothetical protein